eukprot:1194429-Prorocentrum_minimum.AAC.6
MHSTPQLQSGRSLRGGGGAAPASLCGASRAGPPGHTGAALPGGEGRPLPFIGSPGGALLPVPHHRVPLPPVQPRAEPPRAEPPTRPQLPPREGAPRNNNKRTLHDNDNNVAIMITINNNEDS